MNLREHQSRWIESFEESYQAETDPYEKKAKWRYYEIRGRYGLIYSYSESQLAVCFNTKRVANRFRSRKEWVRIMNGEEETVFLFPAQDLNMTAQAIKAKRRRQPLSSERRQKLIELGKGGRQKLLQFNLDRAKRKLTDLNQPVSGSNEALDGCQGSGGVDASRTDSLPCVRIAIEKKAFRKDVRP